MKKPTPAERWMRDLNRLDAMDVADHHARAAAKATDRRQAREDERAAVASLRRAQVIR